MPAGASAGHPAADAAAAAPPRLRAEAPRPAAPSNPAQPATRGTSATLCRGRIGRRHAPASSRPRDAPIPSSPVHARDPIRTVAPRASAGGDSSRRGRPAAPTTTPASPTSAPTPAASTRTSSTVPRGARRRCAPAGRASQPVGPASRGTPARPAPRRLHRGAERVPLLPHGVRLRRRFPRPGACPGLDRRGLCGDDQVLVLPRPDGFGLHHPRWVPPCFDRSPEPSSGGRGHRPRWPRRAATGLFSTLRGYARTQDML